MTESIRLHDYQNEIKQRLCEEWLTHRSVLLQMPTGTGKTHVLAAVVKEYLHEEAGMQGERQGAVWIIAHRRELVAQAEETLARYGIHKTDGQVRVLSIQWLSLHRDDTVESPSLIIIDEAHHAQAGSYRMLWERCPHARFLGLTATPCRMNRSGFTDLFEVLVCSWSIAEFIGKGRLSTFDYVSIRANSRAQQLIDTLEKRGADGDYQIREMDGVLNHRPSIERLYRSVEQFAPNKKGIVYAISIRHARRIAEYYNMQGMNAVAIDSRTPAAERKRLTEEFKAGRIQVLVNVDVFSEGFDCPDVEFVQMARPTLSLSKYLQQVGRGLRKSAGKETCVLIDNVGLYRVFGLPTVAWDWESMFRGTVAGKGRHPACPRSGLPAVTWQEETAVQADEMEVVVSHDQLPALLAEQQEVCPPLFRRDAELKAWQDKESGLWGLQRGRDRITEAMFGAVFGIRYDRAAVRFKDQSCGLVDDTGQTVWRQGRCFSMRFSANRFLIVRTAEDEAHYLDLCNLRMYKGRPEVRKYGGIELLKVGQVYYSRTKSVYRNNQKLTEHDITVRRFGITLFDCNAPAGCCVQSSYPDGHSWGYACLLNGDQERYYWVYRWLADGSVIVTDGSGGYYHTKEGKDKKFVGCSEPVAAWESCRREIGRLAREAEELRRATESAREEKRQKLRNSPEAAAPFRSGMKWGLKIGDRITVPPVYRNVRPPVGKYCAVEKNYSQWGVIALDGTWMVEPQYVAIEISVQGIVTGTKVTGGKVSVKLP